MSWAWQRTYGRVPSSDFLYHVLHERLPGLAVTRWTDMLGAISIAI